MSVSFIYDGTTDYEAKCGKFYIQVPANTQTHSDEAKSPLTDIIPCYFLYIWVLLELVSPLGNWLQLEVHLGDRQN